MNFSNIKNDINLFKDDTLKALRTIEKQLLEKMKMKNIETESKIADFDLKLSKFQEINKRMYESVIEQRVYLEKINDLNDFKSQAETKLISFDAKLGNFLSDLVNIRSRYDKIIFENLNLPVGASYKYSSLSDFIKDSIKIADQLKMEKDLIKKQIDEIKAKNENFEKYFGVTIDNSVYNCKLYTDSKINEIKIFFKGKIDEFNNILTNTKNEIEDNILKNKEISTSIKNEIKNTKKEITYLIEETNKENEKIKNELKKSQNNRINIEINEIKKNINELKESIERKISNSYFYGKNKNLINSYNNNTLSNKNIFLKSNNIFNEVKNKNNLSEVEHIKITASDKNDIYNKNKELFSLYNNQANNINNYKYNENISDTIKEKRNTINKQNFYKEKLLIKEDNINKENIPNKIKTKEKFHIKIAGKNIQLRNIDKSNNMKENTMENKTDVLLTNPNNISNISKNIFINNKEHKIIMPENNKDKNIYSSNKNSHKNITISENNKKIYSFNQNSYKIIFPENTEKNIFSYNKNSFNKKVKISRNKSFSKKPNNIFNLEEKNFSIENINKSKKFINNQNFSKESMKKFFSENKHKSSNKRFVIHSIDDNTISNLKRKISEYNYLNNNKNNIGIKLLKNKIKNINDSKAAYLKSQLPIMGLYKEFYNRKLKEKEEKANELNKTPKKVSPAFGRTEYIKFTKENDNINVKNHNGNMNIVINDNIEDYINKSNYFSTINGELEFLLNINNKNKYKKKKNKDANLVNLSV